MCSWYTIRMQIVTYILLFVISFPLFVLGDLLWLGVVARGFYRERLDTLLGDTNWIAAALFYVVFLAGLTYFATAPALVADDVRRAIVLGAAFGFVAYATYDLTNLATLKHWPVSVTIVDMLWGAVLAAFVSGSALGIYKFFFG